VTIDTLRADHLPAYGYTGVATPNLDALAAESFVFKDAVSHVPLTMPAHTSIMTGLLPPSHGVPENGSYILDSKVTTLAEILAAKGYATGGFVSSFVLDARWQLNQGFGTYFDNFTVPDFHEGNPGLIQRRGAETEAQAEDWIGNNKGHPFFAWVHFYDPHQPYDPPEPFKRRYAKNLYDGEIAYTDEVMGRLLARLRQWGVLDKTLIVVTSDHGEGLGDHGEKTHGVFVYDTTLHIPLFVRLPRGKHADVTGVVRHVDIAPTLLDWLGLAAPEPMQGRSLIPLLEGKEQQPRVAYSETQYSSLHYGWSPLFSVTTARYKYIQAPRPELYDRTADPRETRNLAAERPELARLLKDDLDGALREATRTATAQQVPIDAETEEKLRALGYLGTAGGESDKFRNVDPKDKIALHDSLSDASMALLDHKDAEALAYIDPVIAQDPEMIEARYVAGVASLRLRQTDRAIAEFNKVLEARPDNSRALYNLGTLYQTIGRSKDAEQCFLRVLKLDPKHMPTLVHLANLYRQSKETDKARQRFLEAAALYDEMLKTTTLPARRSEILAKLAEVSFKGGQVDRALESLKQAIKLTPDKPTLHYNLALVYEEKHDLAGAIDAYQKEAELAPQNFRAQRALGVALRDSGRVDEALKAFQRALSAAPQDPETFYRVAETYYLSNRNLQEARRLASQAVTLAPTFHEARELLSQIERRLRSG
jgi:arylsulfatase A-like enzyme/Flp pilus assembly protein TadD